MRTSSSIEPLSMMLKKRDRLEWQAHQDSNPGPADLESLLFITAHGKCYS